jgi:hypothetical protein
LTPTNFASFRSVQPGYAISVDALAGERGIVANFEHSGLLGALLRYEAAGAT